MTFVNSIYLDNNASTPLDPVVAERMSALLGWGLANPASQHSAGRRAKRLLEDARDSIAASLGVRTGSLEPDQIIFTSGATEANNLAVFGMCGEPPGKILVSSLEHPSVGEACQALRKRGFEIIVVRATRSGVLDLNHFHDVCTQDVRLVCLQGANHETGVLQPLDAVTRRCLEFDIPLHVDAVQLVGKQPLDFSALPAASLSASAHKLHGPCGVGVLIVRGGRRILPLIRGGEQQFGMRPGTESVVLAAGFALALERAVNALPERAVLMRSLRDDFESALRSNVAGVVINGGEGERTPHVSNVSFPGCDRQALLMSLDMAGIACSTGSACASGSSEPSPVLEAMGLPERIINSSLRFSLGAITTAAEVAEAAVRISFVVNNLGGDKSWRN